MKNRLLACVLTAVLLAGLLPLPALAAEAAGEITVDSTTTQWTTGNTYVVRSDVTINSRITVEDNVTLRLESGKLTASKGILVGEGSSLLIEGTNGSLIAKGDWGSAGIGGGEESNGGKITINGGTVNATGGSGWGSGYGGAGIGGGFLGSGGTITINGGTVDATGGDGGAGIGGGYGNGGDITISGGKVDATGGDGGAGIGGGRNGDGGDITISGGNVDATGDSGGAGIGGGFLGSGGDITISGGEVVATGSGGGAGIGGGTLGSGGTITISGGTVNAVGIGDGAGIGGGDGGGGTFATGDNGSAFIMASSISDNSETEKGSWKGIIFEENAGQVYGSPTLKTDAEIPSGKTLTVPAGATLTIPENVTLTNNGTIQNDGTILVKPDGKLEGNGNIEGSGNVIRQKKGYTVTVQSDGNGTASTSLSLPFAAQGDEVTLTATPNSGYHFKEWQVVPDSVAIADNKFTMPAQAVTVTAVFEQNKYTVTFDSRDGSTVSAATISDGGKVTKPADPTRSGYTFGGWYKESGCTTAWNFDTDTVFRDMTLYAKWTVNSPTTYTVTFDSQGGSAVSAAAVSDGGKVARPADPIRSGYTFGGWYKESGCTTAWNFDTDTVTGSITLYARWTARPTGGGGGGTYTPPTYPPTVERPSGGGGTPSTSPTNPKQGDTVTVTPKPDSGYEVDTITITDQNGKPVEVTVRPDGTYTFKQPSGRVKIEVTYKPVERPWNNPFTDVAEGDWYYEAVRFVHERGLMNGYSDGRFGPNDTLSRAQLAQILFNKEGRPVVNYLMQYGDVPGETWYAEAVRWATSQGIVSGYGNGTFGPNNPITREQLAVMLWRYSGSPAATNKELHFNDTDEISGFALEAMRWAVENGILNGYGDGRLGPQGQATRAQVAQMLKNFIEKQEEKAGI